MANNASDAVNARVTHWIVELSRLVAGLTSDAYSPAQQVNDHVVDGQNGERQQHTGYEVRRDPEEYWSDPEPGHGAGIEIRAEWSDEPVLLGLSCDGHDDDGLEMLAEYVLKDQPRLTAQRKPLGCFVTDGLREIRFYIIEFTGPHNPALNDHPFNMECAHEPDSLRLHDDDVTIRRYLAEAIARNRA